MRALASVTLAFVAFAPALAARQQPSVDDLLKVGRAYVASYAQRASGAVLDERYTLMDASGGQMGVPTRVSSDLVLLNVNGMPIALRDAYSINGAKIREAQPPRIPALLAEPTTAAWQQALGYSRESQRHFMAEIVVRLNDPMLALRFMTPADPSKFTFTIEGKKKIAGAEVVGLRFQENRGEHTKYILGTRGNAAVSGTFWLEPATGVIRQTDFYVESKSESGRVIVTYALAKDLDMWLPSKTSESYQERQETGGPTGMGAGGVGSSQKVEANATYSNPRHTPIDLTKIR